MTSALPWITRPRAARMGSSGEAGAISRRTISRRSYRERAVATEPPVRATPSKLHGSCEEREGRGRRRLGLPRCAPGEGWSGRAACLRARAKPARASRPTTRTWRTRAILRSRLRSCSLQPFGCPGPAVGGAGAGAVLPEPLPVEPSCRRCLRCRCRWWSRCCRCRTSGPRGRSRSRACRRSWFEIVPHTALKGQVVRQPPPLPEPLELDVPEAPAGGAGGGGWCRCWTKVPLRVRQVLFAVQTWLVAQKPQNTCSAPQPSLTSPQTAPERHAVIGTQGPEQALLLPHVWPEGQVPQSRRAAAAVRGRAAVPGPRGTKVSRTQLPTQTLLEPQVSPAGQVPQNSVPPQPFRRPCRSSGPRGRWTEGCSPSCSTSCCSTSCCSTSCCSTSCSSSRCRRRSSRRSRRRGTRRCRRRRSTACSWSSVARADRRHGPAGHARLFCLLLQRYCTVHVPWAPTTVGPALFTLADVARSRRTGCSGRTSHTGAAIAGAELGSRPMSGSVVAPSASSWLEMLVWLLKAAVLPVSGRVDAAAGRAPARVRRSTERRVERAACRSPCRWPRWCPCCW